jgi:hypothetical protein
MYSSPSIVRAMKLKRMLGRAYNTNRRDDKSVKKSGCKIRRKETLAELGAGIEK